MLDAFIISAVCLINNMGLGKETLKAFGITTCILLFTVVLLYGINILTKMNGNSLEALSSAESIINRNINFNSIYLLSVLVMASVLVPNAVSEVMLDYGTENYKQSARKYLLKQVVDR